MQRPLPVPVDLLGLLQALRLWCGTRAASRTRASSPTAAPELSDLQTDGPLLVHLYFHQLK